MVRRLERLPHRRRSCRRPRRPWMQYPDRPAPHNEPRPASHSHWRLPSFLLLQPRTLSPHPVSRRPIASAVLVQPEPATMCIASAPTAPHGDCPCPRAPVSCGRHVVPPWQAPPTKLGCGATGLGEQNGQGRADGGGAPIARAMTWAVTGSSGECTGAGVITQNQFCRRPHSWPRRPLVADERTRLSHLA